MRIKSCFYLFIFLLAALSLFSCRKTEALFLSDEIWEEVYANEFRPDWTFRAACSASKVKGKYLSLNLADIQKDDLVKSYLDEGKWKKVFLTPLLAHRFADLIRKYKDVQFVYLDSVSEVKNKNILSVIFSRDESLKEMAEVLPLWLKIQNAIAGKETFKLALYFSNSVDRIREDRKLLVEILDPELRKKSQERFFLGQSISSKKNDIERDYEQGRNIFFVNVSFLNSDIFKLLANKEVFFISVDPFQSVFMDNNVLFYFDNNWEKLISEAVQAAYMPENWQIEKGRTKVIKVNSPLKQGRGFSWLLAGSLEEEKSLLELKKIRVNNQNSSWNNLK